MWVLKFTYLKLKRAVPSAFELGEVKCGNEYMHCIMYNVNQWVVRKTRFFPHKKNSLALINKFTCTMPKKNSNKYLVYKKSFNSILLIISEAFKKW